MAATAFGERRYSLLVRSVHELSYLLKMDPIHHKAYRSIDYLIGSPEQGWPCITRHAPNPHEDIRDIIVYSQCVDLYG